MSPCSAFHCVCVQGEKAKLKQKAEEEKAFQSKASLSIPLVDEHLDDVKAAKEVAFLSTGPAQEKRRKRLEIKTQSVFESATSRDRPEGAARSKKARTLLIQARSRTRGGAFSSPSHSSRHPHKAGVVRTDQLRSKLGIKTVGKS